MFRIQQVADGEAGSLFVCVALASPVVPNAELSIGSPVESDVPIMIRAKT